MDEIIILGSEDSGDSIIEVQVPKKSPPPIVDIIDEEIILNIKGEKMQPILAKEILTTENLGSNNFSNNNIAVSSPNHWTADMEKFYNDDWGDEDDFVVEKIQEKMDKTPSLWKMSKKDILLRHNKHRKNYVKCRNCCQPGHNVSVCPDPPYVPKCHMCGTPGHVESSCPNSKCLNCGNPHKYYVLSCYKCQKESLQVCSRCQIRGHNFINCTDHWRLFHLTTESTSVKIPDKNIYKNPKDMWCCNCGRKGHFNTQCAFEKKMGSFSETLPFVVSYQKAFNCNSNNNNNDNNNFKTNENHRHHMYDISKHSRYFHQKIKSSKTDFLERLNTNKMNKNGKFVCNKKLKKHKKKTKKKKKEHQNANFFF